MPAAASPNGSSGGWGMFRRSPVPAATPAAPAGVRALAAVPSQRSLTPSAIVPGGLFVSGVTRPMEAPRGTDRDSDTDSGSLSQEVATVLLPSLHSSPHPPLRGGVVCR